MTDILDVNAIMGLIPHRYPFLFIEQVKDIVPFESATGIKNVSINEHFFQGHFPRKPIMPGVLIIEAMAQTAGVLVAHSLGDEAHGKLVYFMSIDEARFRKPVTPGHVLELRVSKEKQRGAVWRFRGAAYAGETLMAEALITAMIAEG